MKPILCLDFDGVICDSLDETLLITYNGYRSFNNTSDELVTDFNDIPPRFAEFFRKFRYLVRPAGEYWVLLHALETNIIDFNEDMFLHLIQKNKNNVAAFEPVFFKTRKKFQERDFQGWLAMHSMYSEFSEGWEELLQHFKIYIVTTKNMGAVVPLLDYFKIRIPQERIHTKETLKKKNEAIEKIADENNVQTSTIRFVDDHPLHIKDVEQTGAQCYWASWGFYNENRENQRRIDHIADCIREVRE